MVGKNAKAADACFKNPRAKKFTAVTGHHHITPGCRLPGSDKAYYGHRRKTKGKTKMKK